MPQEQDVQFGGLQSLEADERVPVGQALDATNCLVDDMAIRPRNGYRNACATAVGTGTPQAECRFRPSPTFARTLVERGGNVYAVSDPSTETASDGAIQTVGTGIFGATANLSMTQLAKKVYLATDEQGVPWRRARQSGNIVVLDTIQAIAKPPVPTYVLTGPTVYPVHALTTTLSASVTQATVLTDVLEFSRSGSHLQSGDTIDFQLAATYNWESYNWLQIFLSPGTVGTGGSHLQIQLAIDNAGSPGTYESLGEMYDLPDQYGGSPDVAWFDLNQLTLATRQAVKWMRVKVSAGDGKCDAWGFLPVPKAPNPGETDYFVSFFNSTTGAESVLSDPLKVIIGAATITIPNRHGAYRNFDGLVDEGTVSAAPERVPPGRNFNLDAGQPYPTSDDYSGILVLSGTIPASVSNDPNNPGFVQADTVRLWRQTATGIRLVNTAPIALNQTTWTITDDLGDFVLTNQAYRAGGIPPPCSALAAHGGRVCCGGDPLHPNRVFISSYVAINTDLENTANEPFPQFPAVNVDDTDGWSFDIAPSAAEQVLWMGSGDALYIATNEAIYIMTDLTPNAPPDLVFERGVMGRQAAYWAEGSFHRVWGVSETVESGALFWASADGVFASWSHATAHELTKDIRRLYLSWFLPDSSTVVCYQARKLYIFCGTRCLRYDFITESWTRHTLAHTVVAAISWHDPGSALEAMWLLDSGGHLFRWQPGVSPSDSNRATSDAGTAIAAWTYSTGFDVQPQKSRVGYMYLDTDGSVTVAVYKDVGTSNGRTKTFPTAGEHELTWAADLIGYKWRVALAAANTVSVRRLMWDRAPVDARGG